MKRARNQVFGFTLIEILVVVALIGGLATLVLANLNTARHRGRDAQRKSDLRNIHTALKLYYNDIGTYPKNYNNNEIRGCGEDGKKTCEWGEEWSTGNTVYMSTLPADPVSAQSYKYTQIDSETYTLEACLENKGDKEGKVTLDTTWCPSGWAYESSSWGE